MRRLKASQAMIALAMAGATAVLSLLAIVSLTAPDLALAGGIGLAEVHETRAGRALAKASPTVSDLAAAELETRKSLALAPANPRPWLRLSYIDSLRGQGRLSAQGLEMLRRSYVLSPYGPDDSPWRLAFAFNHWGQLTPELRQQALAELTVTDRRQAALAAEVLPQVVDPAGRVALSLMVLPASRN